MTGDEAGPSRLDADVRPVPGAGHPLRRATPPLRPEAPVDSARPSRSALARVVAALLALAVVGLLAFLVVASIGAAGVNAPLAGRSFYVDPDSSAAVAAETTDDPAERHAAEVIAAQPAAVWLTPEEDPPGEVGEHVRRVMTAAGASSTVPVFVVYGMPGRDCGGQSAGGLSAEAYGPWVEEIASALGGRRAVVVVEPDSLALADECGDAGRRTALIAEAVDGFARTVAFVYLDAGHSNWVDVGRMADLLERAGVDRVRGFATNVSNAQTTEAERTYARRIAEELGGAHAVIDVSRNGEGPPIDDAWCNAPGLALGADPAGVQDEVVDAELWVKPPGESDGHCNGGPAAGEWWPEGAIALVRNAGQ
ncbi:glycoside hydrolase family 6 protein [Agromyces sp. MMS24-K17]|uniref:glycoside hydrolase family 6 protein n=1 Tax=Agromyces sp. MMS24-K17 TaxID=3372850 RepID=UPI00375487FD